ncbi:hypothetical protein SAMN05216302_10042 [Nitrosomonas aestuarii]|uniref:Transposase zinc-ribbon domain-containing protein n=1 Tax=Nitrosomonas aestuarii TaxID=52441 RepID=A0A1I3YJB2_9PROT|nr:GDCCVxC domain-containing (seleno)protein [Nitrosomonas aestuarii]SFK31429.1 hypothetical protein SAMN05216302_10042 [Nitrosomonas aestuarii]
MSHGVVLKSQIKCPECGYRKVETMPTDSYLWFYVCEKCRVILKPLKSECCIFCTYGSVPCIPIQLSNLKERNCC